MAASILNPRVSGFWSLGIWVSVLRALRQRHTPVSTDLTDLDVSIGHQGGID